MMAHLNLWTINKKTNLPVIKEVLPVNITNVVISSISFILAVLREAVIQSSSPAEARCTMQLIKSIAEVTRPPLRAELSVQSSCFSFVTEEHSLALCIHGRGLNPPPLHSSRLLAPH